MIGDEGFVVDPQVQVVYQHLQFGKAHDVDVFEIKIGKPEHWIILVGGRLTQTFALVKKHRSFLSIVSCILFVILVVNNLCIWEMPFSLVLWFFLEMLDLMFM
ncbi:transporter [Bartonella vinsonii]|nr:transporter [Bartonella vinsonii]